MDIRSAGIVGLQIGLMEVSVALLGSEYPAPLTGSDQLFDIRRNGCSTSVGIRVRFASEYASGYWNAPVRGIIWRWNIATHTGLSPSFHHAHVTQGGPDAQAPIIRAQDP
jgi:hypothetical protein